MHETPHEDLISQAEAAAARGELARAERLFAEFLTSSPENWNARFDLATVRIKMGRLDEAIKDLEQVLAAVPEFLPALKWLSGLYLNSNRFEEAAIICEKTVKLHPNQAEPLNALGVCYLELGRYSDAVRVFSEATQLRPDVTALRLRLGSALLGQNNFAGALREFQEALRLEPANLAAKKSVAECLIKLGLFEQAILACRSVLLTDSSDLAAKEILGRSLFELGRFEELDAHMSSVLETEGENYGPLVTAGHFRMDVGDFESARSYFERAIAVEPDRGPAYFGLIQAGLGAEVDPTLIEKMLAISTAASLDDNELTQVNFALGKVFEDRNEFEKSMSHYDLANRHVLRGMSLSHSYDRAGIESQVDETIRTYTKEFFERNRHLGDPSELPLLVIGMIRSGTTLTEQVIASHPQCEGAGELKYWELQQAQSGPYQKRNPKSDDVSLACNEYLETLRKHGRTSLRVVDKMPGNYYHVGAIHLHFPNACFVHLKRNPLDNCLSIWTTHFAIPSAFVGSKSNIVHCYRQYLRLMEHWKTVLPSDRLIEVEYESLVSDKERVIRDLISSCGLSWDEKCLHQEQRKSRVQTPSRTRVRSAIDTSRVQRWKKFEPWLGEFINLV
jgi:tetratricopeptide (TPR) repeat protein